MAINKEIDIPNIYAIGRLDDLEIVTERVRPVLTTWSEKLTYDVLPELLAKKLKPDLIVGSYNAITSLIHSHTYQLSSSEYKNVVSEFEYVEHGELAATYTVIKVIKPQVLKLILVPVDMEDKLYVIDTNKHQCALVRDCK